MRKILIDAPAILFVPIAIVVIFSGVAALGIGATICLSGGLGCPDVIGQSGIRQSEYFYWYFAAFWIIRVAIVTALMLFIFWLVSRTYLFRRGVELIRRGWFSQSVWTRIGLWTVVAAGLASLTYTLEVSDAEHRSHIIVITVLWLGYLIIIWHNRNRTAEYESDKA